jgi:plastocyanin
MKMFLTLLTGIVFVITILVAAGCNQVNKEVTTEDQEATLTESDFESEILAADETKVWITLQDTSIGCKKHLIMQNVTHDKRSKKVIDTLETLVYPGDTVRWVKAKRAELNRVHQVRILDSSPWDTSDSCLAGEEIETLRGPYIEFVIPSDADSGIVKYEIIFQDKDKNYWYIDPQLKIPPR